MSTLDTSITCDPSFQYEYPSELPFPHDTSCPLDPVLSNPYPTRYPSTSNVRASEIESSIENGSRGSTVDLSGTEVQSQEVRRRAQTLDAQRTTRQRRALTNEEVKRELSHDSIDSIERTPAQKMRRLVQNRVSQRNFRKRQQNQRERLEQQVKSLSAELEEMRKLYGDLMGRYEQARRGTSESSIEGSSGGGGGGGDWMGNQPGPGLYDTTLFA